MWEEKGIWVCVREKKTDGRGKMEGGKFPMYCYNQGRPLEVKCGERGKGSLYSHTATELVT